MMDTSQIGSRCIRIAGTLDARAQDEVTLLRTARALKVVHSHLKLATWTHARTQGRTQQTVRAEAALDALDASAFSEDAVKTALEAELQRRAWKAGPFFGPIRVALTGKTRTPPNFPMLAALGKERSLTRLRDAIDLLASD